MNLNEILDMLEQDVVATSGMTKEANEKEVPAGAEKFTKSASAIKEAEELGAQVAATLLKAAEEETKETSETKAEEKKETEAETKSDKDNTKTEKEENMDKKASLVDVISAMLEKSALNDTDQNVATSPVVPNLVQADVSRLVADQDAVVNFTPGTNGTNQGGTVNQILDAIVAKAEGQGAVEAEAEGAAPAERQDEDVEKTAAVIELVNNGVDFDSAVNMVKQAAEEIQAEEFEVEKKAAFDALIEAGIDFNDAAILVKEACEDMEKAAGIGSNFINTVKRDAGKAGVQFGNLTGGNPHKRVASLKDLASNKAVQIGAAGTTLAAGGAYAGMREKKASEDGEAWGATGRSIGRGMLQGAGGAIGGAGAGALASKLIKNPAGKAAAILGGYTVGGVAGSLHGQKASIKKSLAAAREKKAAYDALVADGVDFETAAICVAEASQDLYGC